MNTAADLSNLLGAGGLPNEDLESVTRFMTFFSLAEAKIVGLNDGLAGTDKLSNLLIDGGFIDAAALDAIFQYFVTRYRSNEEPNERFSKLAPTNFVNGKLRERFLELLLSIKPSPNEKLSFVLKVMLRLRHNLFHGVKWAYLLQGQRDNFDHSTEFLLMLLNRTKGELWSPDK